MKLLLLAALYLLLTGCYTKSYMRASTEQLQKQITDQQNQINQRDHKITQLQNALDQQKEREKLR